MTLTRLVTVVIRMLGIEAIRISRVRLNLCPCTAGSAVPKSTLCQTTLGLVPDTLARKNGK
jgi:hypothetical protein